MQLSLESFNAFSLLLHAMTIYYSIQITGKLSFSHSKRCLTACLSIYTRAPGTYVYFFHSNPTKNSYVIVISCYDNEVGNFSAFLLFKPKRGLWHGKCDSNAMKRIFPNDLFQSHLFGYLLSIIYDDYTHWLVAVDVLNF